MIPCEEQHSEDRPSSSAGQRPWTGPPAVAECRQRKNRIPNMINIAKRPAKAEGELNIGR